MNTITITLPLPHKVLHPNGRTRHYGKRLRLTKSARTDAYYASLAVLEGRQPLWPAVVVQPTFYLARRMDGDGLAAWLKAYLDGAIQDAKIAHNDSAVVLLPPEQVTAKAAKGKREVVLVITRVDQP